MSRLKKIKEDQKRAEIQAGWLERFYRLNMSQAVFCERNGIDKTVFSRYLSCDRMANDVNFKKIESAFEKELAILTKNK